MDQSPTSSTNPESRAAPKPYAWGKFKKSDRDTYFLMAEFREVGHRVCAFSYALQTEIALTDREMHEATKNMSWSIILNIAKSVIQSWR